MNHGSQLPDLSLLAINLTQRCNLACAHCYLDARALRHAAADELSTLEVTTLLDDIAAMGNGTMIVLTGGEPLLRRDLESIVAHGTARGLPVVVGTNGMLLTTERIRSLQDAGVLGVGISIDSLDPKYHDHFRGRQGAWKHTMAGVERCRTMGLDFQLHFSVTDSNAHELPAMIEFAQACGARVLNVFFLICVGRGQSVSDITPARYERVLGELLDAQARYPELIVRPRCAPHYKRIAHQRNPAAALNRISGREGDGCIAGLHYARVAQDGRVTACPYIDASIGNVRDDMFSRLWCSAPDFQRLRQPRLSGKCGCCEYRELCGGCRARPMAAGRGMLDADDFCTYTPRGSAVIRALTDTEMPAINWNREAALRLQRVPEFLRKMVKKRAEAYVAGLGETEVTPKHLAVLSARRFGTPPQAVSVRGVHLPDTEHDPSLTD